MTATNSKNVRRITWAQVAASELAALLGILWVTKVLVIHPTSIGSRLYPDPDGFVAVGLLMSIGLFWILVATCVGFGLAAATSGWAYARLSLITLSTLLTLSAASSAYWLWRYIAFPQALPFYETCMAGAPLIGLVLAVALGRRRQ